MNQWIQRSTLVGLLATTTMCTAIAGLKDVPSPTGGAGGASNSGSTGEGGTSSASTHSSGITSSTLTQSATGCPSNQVACLGACVDTQTDSTNCGVCGNACASFAANSTCQQGQCACPTGQAQCIKACVDKKTDSSNCGTCGNACSAYATGANCQGGSCACPSGESVCSGACVDKLLDPKNCGGCGTDCANTAPTATCQQGVCTCPAGQSVCNHVCVDEKTDSTNCGGCTKTCGTGTMCDQGTCEPSAVVDGGAVLACPLNYCWFGLGGPQWLAVDSSVGGPSTAAQPPNGALCISGTVGQVPLYADGGYGWDNHWGAQIGMNLNQPSGSTTVGTAAFTSVGLTYAVDVIPPNFRINVDTAGVEYCFTPTVTSGTIPWDQFQNQCWQKGAGPTLSSTPTLQKLDFGVTADTGASHPFHFCILQLSM